MKRIINLSVLLFVTISLISCKNNGVSSSTSHSIFLVRHAEKAEDGTKDPPLTSEGIRRAESLADMLKYENISKIYATNFKRTKETANPLATRNDIKVEIYDPKDSNFARKLKNESKDHNILVVGHSNSTPSLVNSIISDDKYQQIDESDYTNLFVIEQKNNTFSASKRSY